MYFEQLVAILYNMKSYRIHPNDRITNSANKVEMCWLYLEFLETLNHYQVVDKKRCDFVYIYIIHIYMHLDVPCAPIKFFS